MSDSAANASDGSSRSNNPSGPHPRSSTARKRSWHADLSYMQASIPSTSVAPAPSSQPLPLPPAPRPASNPAVQDPPPPHPRPTPLPSPSASKNSSAQLLGTPLECPQDATIQDRLSTPAGTAALAVVSSPSDAASQRLQWQRSNIGSAHAGSLVSEGGAIQVRVSRWVR